MTTLEASTVDTVSRPRLFRTAGGASFALAGAFLLQLALLFVIFGNDDPTESLGDFLDRTHLPALTGGVMWLVAGVATFLVTSAVGSLWGAEGMFLRLARFFGFTASIALLLTGTIDLSATGLAGQLLAQVPGGTDAGWVGYQAVSGVIWTATRLLACLGEAVWLVALATAGRKAGLVGLPTSILCFVAAAVILLPSAAFGQLSTQLFVIPTFVVLAIVFLRKSQTA